MFPDPLNVRYDDVGTTASPVLEPVPFSIKNLNGSSSIRTIPSTVTFTANTAAQAFKEAGGELALSHQDTGKGAGARTRRRVKFSANPINPLTGKTELVEAYVVFTQPRDLGAQDSPVRKCAMAQMLWLRSFLKDANVPLLVDGNV